MNEIISFGRFRCRELALHKNRGMEITYIEKGALEWVVDGATEKIGPGTLFFTLPWQIHGSVQPKEPANTIWHILFHLTEDYPQPRKTFGLPASLGFTPAEMRQLSTIFAGSRRHGFRATAAMRWLMPALIQELQNDRELGQAHAASLLRAVLVEFKRIITGEVSDPKASSGPEIRVQQLMEELAARCDQPWTLEQMAERCGVRRTRLNTVFQRLTGSTPVDYLIRLRLERAKTLLRESPARIIEIAFACGFSSSQYFANIFRRETGLTPTAYRDYHTGPACDRPAAVEFRSEQEERLRVQHFSADQ